MISILVLLSIAAYHTDSTCVNLPDVVQYDTYLEHHLLGETIRPSVFDCAVFCQAHSRCFSFGFEPQKRLCHLHKSHLACAPSDFIAKGHWIHGEIADFPKSLWGPCAGHNCGIGQKCTTNRVTKMAECVKGPYVRVEKSAGHTFDPYIENLPNKTFQDVTGGTTSLVFFYKGCQNCVVTLCNADSLSYLGCYYAFIGKTAPDNVGLVMPGNTKVASYHEDGIVSCTKFSPFWITWDKGVIAVGKGDTVGEQQILSYQLPSPYEVNNIGLSVFIDTNGTWLVYRQN